MFASFASSSFVSCEFGFLNLVVECQAEFVSPSPLSLCYCEFVSQSFSCRMAEFVLSSSFIVSPGLVVTCEFMAEFAWRSLFSLAGFIVVTCEFVSPNLVFEWQSLTCPRSLSCYCEFVSPN